MMRRFLDAFADELRLLLTTILGRADALQAAIGRQLDDESKRSLDVIIRNTIRLTNLINDALDLARLHLGALQPLSYRFDAARVVAEIAETFSPVAAGKGLTLSYTLPPEAVAVQTDVHRLRQLLGYLIDNAIKFTRRGEIGLHLSTRGAAFVIEVRDTGIGIRASDLPHVFEDFRQFERETTWSYGGCGLGLAVGRRLVALLGGTIEAESQIGRGSSFRVVLPRHPFGRVDGEGPLRPDGAEEV
jgi:signal transduction histidine kinase